VNIAKTITGFVKEFKVLQVKGGLAEGHIMSPEQIQSLASMPPRQVLIAQVVGGLQAPVASFVNTMQQLYAGMIWALQGVADKRS
jgi:large subunit ribosomal protein L10